MNEYGGSYRNNLVNVLDNTQDDSINEISNIVYSPYMEFESIISHLRENIHNFTVFSLNAQSIRSKFDQVYSIMSNLFNHRLHFSAICFQETWLDENADVSLIQLPGYHLISKGKTCCGHGGLIIYLHKDFTYNIRY